MQTSLAQFETLISDLSARFINLLPDQVDGAIERALGELREFFKIDRWGLLEVFSKEGTVHLSHVSYGPGIQELSRKSNLEQLFPWCYRRLVEEGQSCIYSNLMDMPAEADADRHVFQASGIQSIFMIPLCITGKVKFIMAANSLWEARHWPEEYISRLRLLGEIFINALERKKSEEARDEVWRFETLLSNLSARFINLPSDQVDQVILEAQQSVCECLGLGLLSTLFQWPAENPNWFILTHIYRPLGGPPIPDQMDAREYFPWSLQQLRDGRVILFSSIEDYPAEAARDQEVLRYYGVKNNVTFPLSVGGGATIGALSFHSLREERTWPETIVNRLQLVAQIFANALARKQADQALRQSEARFSLAADSANLGLWILDLKTDRFWISEKTRTLFGFTADEEVTFERFLQFVYPEDREYIWQSRQEMMESREDFRIDYRIQPADGALRWIVSQGRTHFSAKGEPEQLIGVSIDITDRKELEAELKSRLSEIEKLKQQLEQENIYLREETQLTARFENLDGSSEALKLVLTQIQQVAPTNSTVLILGETGTGKELIAQAIHNLSPRRKRVLVKVNCASLPAALVESELFGREKGAYTGAMTSQVGRFELANGSTLFLDEIGELSLELQAKLLRILQEGEFERLGSPKTIRVDVRVIAATNRNLHKEVEKGRFREDLYYRLKVFPIEMPPLRKRTEDIPALVGAFMREFSEKMGKNIHRLPKGALEAMQKYHWPGNIRELRNLIEQAFIISEGEILKINVPQGSADAHSAIQTLEKMECQHILQALEKCRGRIKGAHGAAQLLGLKPSTLYSKLEKLGIPTSRLRDGRAT